MEYPILPGSVIPQEVGNAGQRIAPGHAFQRPNAVERQVQYVDSIPMQRPTVYAQPSPVISTALPGYQQVVIRPVAQEVAASPPVAYAVPAHIPSTRAKSERCCTTRLTIVVSVFIICALIGAGIGVYYKYGRNGEGKSDDDGKDSNSYHNCVAIGTHGSDSNSLKPSEKDDHDGKESDDESKPDSESDKSVEDKKDEDKEGEGKEETDKENTEEEKGKKPGGRPHHDDGKKPDKSSIPDCFHEKEDGTFSLDDVAGVIYYDGNGAPQWLENLQHGSWALNDDNNLSFQGNSNDKLPDGVTLCKD